MRLKVIESVGEPFVSIIIPCKSIDRYTQECIEGCKKLDYPKSKYEIIVLPDGGGRGEANGVKIIPTGPVTPGAKRNKGAKKARGEVLAFIDSDAYPREDWLKNSVKYLLDDQVVAVGGPAITPPQDGDMQKASGYVFSSILMGGLSRRYKVKRTVETDDVHSCNLIVKKWALEKIGGWNEKYWPGEDTLFCLFLKKVGRIIETTDLVVYHHRKPLFKKHLKQVSRFALHRGFFAKRFKGNSLKLIYFIPSILVLFLFFGLIFSLFNEFVRLIYLASIAVYLITCLIVNFFEVKERSLIPMVWIGLVLTHIVYGVYFLIGLLKRDLER